MTLVLGEGRRKAHHRQGKGELPVGLARALAIEDQPTEVVLGLDLREDQGREDRDLEHDEDAVLQARARVVELQEHQPGQQGDDDVVEEAGEAVVGRAIKRLVLPFVDHFDLVPQRRGVLLGLGLGPHADVAHALGLDAEDGLLGLGQLVGIRPDLAPVFVADAWRLARSDGVEHPFGWIRVRRADRAVLFEVVAQNLGIPTYVAEVDRLAAPLEEKQAVEVLEERGIRLMDGAEDGLPGGGELAEKTDDVKGGLRVETRRRFVEEQEELGLGGEFDADGDSLALFDGQAGLGLADDGIGDILHLEQRDDLLDIGILLFDRSLVRLS